MVNIDLARLLDFIFSSSNKWVCNSIKWSSCATWKNNVQIVSSLGVGFHFLVISWFPSVSCLTQNWNGRIVHINTWLKKKYQKDDLRFLGSVLVICSCQMDCIKAGQNIWGWVCWCWSCYRCTKHWLSHIWNIVCSSSYRNAKMMW